MRSKIKLEDYIDICNKKHNNKYDYSLVDITDQKIKIICPEHGEFEQNKASHKFGYGCWKCSVEERSRAQSHDVDRFIESAKLKHQDKYDYSLVIYKNTSTKIKIVCLTHGIFEQIPGSHLNGNGCPKCGSESQASLQSYDNTKFISKSMEIHKDKYDYSLVEYKNSKSKVKIICKEHGIFEQYASNHIKGYDCPKCKGRIFDRHSFIKNCESIHKSKYDYSLVEYKSSEDKIEIICPDHGIFKQTISNHLHQKSGCPMCYGINLKSNTEDFINKCINIHLDRYDYSLVDYKQAKEHVTIVCRKHGEFKQAPTHHLSGKGCPVCKSSKGENRIFNFLKSNYIDFKHHYIFDDLTNYEFDFYIEDLNLLIEYDGVQHFKPVSYFGGMMAFENQKLRDKEKDEYCNTNNIRLLRIPYTISDIEGAIRDYLMD